MKPINTFLNNITTYKLTLYSLTALIGLASILGFLGFLPYNGFSILLSTLILKTTCWLTNYLFSKSFRVPPNIESSHITALILTLLITPITSLEEFPFLLWAAVLSIASKYILTINKKHLFNPAAIALVITTFSINQSPSWWIGTPQMIPALILTGILITTKLRRWDLVLPFLVISTFTTTPLTPFEIGNWKLEIGNFLYPPLLFLTFFMLTEPSTTPPTRKLRIIYAALIGLLISPKLHLGPIYATPELALVIGNIFSYIPPFIQRGSGGFKLLLTLNQKTKIANNIYEFTFTTNAPLHFKPGQYLEWTINPDNSDNRGNRRYFTITSSPTEKNLKIAIRYNDPSSTFKKHLLQLNPNDQILAGQLSGDFTLPANPKQPLIFIAGGIGITPFRSIIKYLLDQNQKRPITLFYATKTPNEIAYRELLTEAEKKLGIKTIYTLTHLNPETIKKQIPNYQKPLYYLSGPNAMITTYKTLLLKLKIPRHHILTDYFPGF